MREFGNLQTGQSSGNCFAIYADSANYFVSSPNFASPNDRTPVRIQPVDATHWWNR